MLHSLLHVKATDIFKAALELLVGLPIVTDLYFLEERDNVLKESLYAIFSMKIVF